MSRAMFTIVTVVGPTALITGPNAKKLIVEAGGRGIWDRRRRAWATTARVGEKVLAICDMQDLPVAFQREVSA